MDIVQSVCRCFPNIFKDCYFLSWHAARSRAAVSLVVQVRQVYQQGHGVRREVCLATIDLFTLSWEAAGVSDYYIWSLISWLFDDWPLPNMLHSLGLIGWLGCLCVDLLTWWLRRGSECSPDGWIDFLIMPLIGCLSGSPGAVEICPQTLQ